jgi:hypothetical protein
MSDTVGDRDAALREAVISQFLAALEMLRQVILKCPDEFWTRSPTRNQFWRVAYHTLFYVHLYLQDVQSAFVPWPKHRNEVESMRPDTDPERADAVPYSRDDVLEYLDFCVEQVRRKIASVDFDAASGFSWLRCNKLELQFYTIRHVQQHVGELGEQLSDKLGIETPWVGSGQKHNP